MKGLKFATFDAKDEKGINKFLHENQAYVASNGCYVFEGRLSFMWVEKNEDDLRVESIVSQMNQKVIEQETQIALQQVEVIHIEEEIKHAGKGANVSVLADSKAILNAMKRKLDVTKKVMEQIKSGEFALS